MHTLNSISIQQMVRHVRSTSENDDALRETVASKRTFGLVAKMRQAIGAFVMSAGAFIQGCPTAEQTAPR
jgi:hypothetical protein